MSFALKPEAVPGASDWLKNASVEDKRVIERVLRMAGQKNELENSMRKTLLPDAKDTVEKWMKNANEEGEYMCVSCSFLLKAGIRTFVYPTLFIFGYF